MVGIPHGDEPHVPMWPSMSDLALCTALVMILYVVVQFVVSYEATALTLEIETRQEALARVVSTAVGESFGSQLRIAGDGNLQRITFSDQVLFDSGRAELKPTGKLILQTVGGVLRERSESFARVLVEGHTDDRPLRRDSPFPSNWELSSARATSVVRFLHDDCGLEPKLLSASGYSQFHPIDDRDHDDARGLNRRVELVVVYSAEEIRSESLDPKRQR